MMNKPTISSKQKHYSSKYLQQSEFPLQTVHLLMFSDY